ncbi:MAG: zinc ribbon domain-containing protein [candidate division NC10 bacterium]|nr:zinc ribbon domain-containing protein [candidate division NC10 bacterium]
MPIYEYHCDDCRRRVSILVRSISNPGRPTCPRCGGHHLERLMSRFARLRSEDDRLDALADPSSFGDLDENDPKTIARFAKKMGGELGEDLGEDFDQVMEEALEEEAAGAGKSADGGDDLDDL